MGIKILIVEDDGFTRELYRHALEGKKIEEIFEAGLIVVAEEILSEHPDIAVVTVDGELKDTASILETAEFVKRVRASGFAGDMIAASSDDIYNRLLALKGCNYRIEGRKMPSVPEKIIEVLGL